MTRVATWNVNSLRARIDRVDEWLGYAKPDILCMQETKMPDGIFPYDHFSELGYEAIHYGHNQWNGVAILSRVGLEPIKRGFFDEDGDGSSEARSVWAECGGIKVGSVYVPNGRALDDPHMDYKLQWLTRLKEHLGKFADPTENVVVCGDFNVAPADEDVWDISKMDGMTHVSEPERSAFRSVCDWGLTDSFRELNKSPGLFTWWDFRGGSFHKHEGMRIDFVLASNPMSERAYFATVDRNARKGTKPSDHAPLFVDFG